MEGKYEWILMVTDHHQVEYNALPKALHILRMNISQLKTIHRQIHEISTHTALNTMIVVIGGNRAIFLSL